MRGICPRNGWRIDGVNGELMILDRYYEMTAVCVLLMAPLVFAVLLKIEAPYGRYVRRGWGPGLGNRAGWLLMESPAVLVFGALVLIRGEWGAAALWLFLLWQWHYCYRAFVYPWTLAKERKMPWLIVAMGMLFNTLNGYLNGWNLAVHPEKYALDWLLTPQFVAGLSLFFLGMLLNRLSDRQLARLGRTGGGYQIPRGYGFRWVSCPNYFGEILQWCGWAIATWSLAGLVFAIWTVANLVPRAIAHHRWYRLNFSDYPADRKAVIPYLL